MGTERVKCFAQERNTMVGLEPKLRGPEPRTLAIWPRRPLSLITYSEV